MTAVFEHGYALIVGVNDNRIQRLALPDVEKDVQAVYEVLVHPERCAYKSENVRLLKGEESTRQNILEGLYWLQDKVKGDAEATAVIYYSGHGMVDKNANQYYLVPYDIQELSRLRAHALRAEDLTAEISAVSAKRMLAILDCCHAGGMDVKDVDLEAIDAAANVEAAAFPLDLPETKSVPLFEAAPGEKSVHDLKEGNGRAILNSSTGAQSSFVRTDRAMSLFTYHLIEALTGHAPHPDDATVVYVTDVMSWVTHRVKKSAREQGRDQTPVMRTSGVFPIAQLIGGQGLSKGIGQLPPDPLAPLPEVGTINQAGRNIASGTAGRDIVAGDLTKTTVKQKGGVNIQGGFNMSGGSFVGSKNQEIHGDNITGDKVGGDQFSGSKFGNISGSGGNFAVGPGAAVHVQQGANTDELMLLFTPLLAEVARYDPTAVPKVHVLKTEVERGEKADDEKIADLIGDIADAAPAVIETLVNLFTNSVAAKAAGGATKYILRRIRR
jgi:hypothetical protein